MHKPNATFPQDF